jgi:hypothetical protein
VHDEGTEIVGATEDFGVATETEADGIENRRLSGPIRSDDNVESVEKTKGERRKGCELELCTKGGRGHNHPAPPPWRFAA